MAYLDIDQFYATPSATTQAPVRADAGFTALEWQVIALARRDSLCSLHAPGRLHRLLTRLFGLRTASKLADPRLETLRRLAVHAWQRGFAIPAQEVEAFAAAGFARAQLETLVTRITGLRAAA